jgi:hypothetical protein
VQTAAAYDREPKVAAGVMSELTPAPFSLLADTGLLGGAEAHMLTVRLRSTGDKKRDALRMRRIHGLVTSYPGNDRFAFHVYEGSRRYHLEFPNSTTGYCPELHAQLLHLLGDGSVQVEPLRIQ